MNDEASLKALGLRLRAAREAAGLSVPELAKRVGTHRSYIDRLEKGERRPAAEWLQKIADELGLDAAYFLTYIGVRPSATLPAPRDYFLRKLGVSEDEADFLAHLIEHQTQQRRRKSDEEHSEERHDSAH
jgi:transcriptional regulator with XRE-family HTH domain